MGWHCPRLFWTHYPFQKIGTPVSLLFSSVSIETMLRKDSLLCLSAPLAMLCAQWTAESPIASPNPIISTHPNKCTYLKDLQQIWLPVLPGCLLLSFLVWTIVFKTIIEVEKPTYVYYNKSDEWGFWSPELQVVPLSPSRSDPWAQNQKPWAFPGKIPKPSNDNINNNNFTNVALCMHLTLLLLTGETAKLSPPKVFFGPLLSS